MFDHCQYFNLTIMKFRKWRVTNETDPKRFLYYYNYLEIVTNASFYSLEKFEQYANDSSLRTIPMLDIALAVRNLYLFNICIIVYIPGNSEVGLMFQWLMEHQP